MDKRFKYQSGQKIGECYYIHDLPTNGNRRALFKCGCGNTFTTAIANVKNGHTRSCGCIKRLGEDNHSYKHGLSKHWLFSRWMDIKKRCYDKNCEAYKYYGDRGISMYNKWLEDFGSFYNYIIKLPDCSSKLTIDRINNNSNYEPGNIRFANSVLQAVNRRKRKDNKTGFTGVTFRGQDQYRSVITVNKKGIRLGTFKTSIDAVKARDQYIINNNLIDIFPLQVLEIERAESMQNKYT